MHWYLKSKRLVIPRRFGQRPGSQPGRPTNTLMLFRRIMVKRAILEWIASSKRPETRAKRIVETVASAARNIRANQWRQ